MCVAIAEYLMAHIDEAERIPLSRLRQIAHGRLPQVTEAEIGSSIGFLTNSVVNLLELVCFLHYDEEADYIPIPYSDVKAVIDGKKIVDPNTGELAEVRQDQVLCFFSASNHAKSLLHAAS